MAVHVLDRKSTLKAGKHVYKSSAQQRGLTVSAGVVSWKENVKGERKEIKDNCCGNAREIWRKVRVVYYRSDQSASRKEMEEAGREGSKNCLIDCVKEYTVHKPQCGGCPLCHSRDSPGNLLFLISTIFFHEFKISS